VKVSARPAVAADISDVEQLANHAVEEKLSQRGGPLWSLLDLPTGSLGKLLADSVSSSDHLVLVGEIDGAAVGFAAAALVEASDGGPPVADLIAIHVIEPARGVGVGESLMDSVLQWARDRGCRGVESTALPGDRNTKNFFESFGLVARAIRVHRKL